VLILSALKDKVEIFTITRHMSREQLTVMRNTSQFTCPQCENPLRLKIGKAVIPHFAHIVLSNCTTSFSERESPTHLDGKQQLAEFFTRIGCEVSVEAYLPKISQRPDLLVRKNKKLFAIEFQCSVISIQDVVERNKGYKKIKIPAIWLLRTPTNMNATSIGITIIKLSKFMQCFIQKLPISGQTLITFDPVTSQFVYMSQLVHISGTSFIAKVRYLPTSIQTFPFAEVKPLTITEGKGYWQFFQQKRSRFLRNRTISGKYGTKDRFLVNCYKLQIRPEVLPLYIGFPIQDSEAIQEHVVEWQLKLICELYLNEIAIGDMNSEWIKKFTESMCKVYHLKNAVKAVTRYCKFLQEINFDSYQTITQQSFSESKLINHFHEVIVAKS